MEREPLVMRFCLRCGKPVYDGTVCEFCGFDLRRDEHENSPPALSVLTRLPAALLPTLDLMRAARLFLIIILIVGSLILGAISYEIGGRRYFDENGHKVLYPETNEEYATFHTFSNNEHFIHGFLAGVALLSPILLSIYMKIRREFFDQRKPEFRHPWNIWIIVNSAIVLNKLV